MKQYKKHLIAIFAIALIYLIVVNYSYLKEAATSAIIKANVEDIPGNAPENTYPLLLLHGFNPTYSKRLAEFSLDQLQEALARDLNYTNKGIYINTITCAQLKYTKNPIIIRASYYTTLKNHDIENYAENLKAMIDRIISCTGAEKIDIITHSMGGIVTRYYLANINSNDNEVPIRKVIMLATPNNGQIYGVGNIANFIIEKTEKEYAIDFLQLTEQHAFMKELHEKEELKRAEKAESIEFYTIAGNIDGKGDGLVLAKSVALANAENSIVPCNHVIIKHPRYCAEGYEIVKKALGSN